MGCIMCVERSGINFCGLRADLLAFELNGEVVSGRSRRSPLLENLVFVVRHACCR